MRPFIELTAGTRYSCRQLWCHTSDAAAAINNGVYNVIKYALLAFAVLLAAPTAQAATVDAATITKSIEQTAGDPVKVKAYCDMSKKMTEVGDDDKKAEAAGPEIDGYFKTIGPEFEAAWNAGQEAGEDTPEGKAFDAAMTKLDAACPK